MKRKYEQVMRLSSSDEYETPAEIFDALHSEFLFNLDPCASEENHKCTLWFSQEENGLMQDWGGCRVFCNPPYSNIARWVEKCYYEALKPGTICVMLIPARTDTKYFHDYILHRAEIRFIKGRIKFSGAKYGAPFPSMIVIYRAPGM